MNKKYESIVLENKDNHKFVWIPISKASEAIIENEKKNRTSGWLSEEGFPILLESLKAAGPEQVIPEVETKNKLDTLVYGDNKVLTLEKADGSEYDAILFYIHGGMYAAGIDAMHIKLCDKLVDDLNVKVYMPLYPYAPWATYKEAYNFLDEVYPDILAEGKPIYIMGDSAGGGLSFAYTEYLKEKGERIPDKLVGLSPWVDISNSNSIMPDYAVTDYELGVYGPREMGKIWAGGTDTTNYMLSPLFGNLEGLPDTMIITGTGEIICPDSIQLYKKLKNFGKKVTLVLGEDLPHVFPCADTPDSDEARKLIKEFINE